MSRNEFHPALVREMKVRDIEMRAVSDWTKVSSADRQRLLGGSVWFYDCIRYPVRLWRLRNQMRRWGAPLVAWNQDAPHYLNRAMWRLDWLDWARLLDIYATHTLIDSKRTFADTWLYLPNAADIPRYSLGNRHLDDFRREENFDLDVSFYGAMDGRKYKEMKARQEFFAALAQVLGGKKGLRFEFGEAAGLTLAELSTRIQRTKISLNFGASCEYRAPTRSGLPERCYGIPALGGFILCDRRTHAQADFRVGYNWAEFDDLDDCVAKIDFWLANWSAARDLADRCHHHVMASHTYAQRAEKLHEALLNWHEGQRGFLG